MRKKVLIVDDEEDLTWSISKNLAKDKEMFEIICVNNGQEALNVLSQIPVDLVVSDIKMPGITGLELLVKIKETYATTKVIIMTAFGSAEVQKEATSRGSLYYIEKPFEIEDLRTLIHQALTEKKGFDGKVSDFQLSDLIQMNVLGRMVAALIVTKGEEKGLLYFNDGNVVHAQCGTLKGEEAFYKVLGWEKGNFEFRKGERPEEETITQGWQSLLLEGMRRKDEVTPETKTQMKEVSRQESLDKIKVSLNEFMKIKGTELVAIVDETGYSRASVFSDKKEPVMDLTILPSFIPAGLEYLNKIDAEMKVGGLRLATIEYNQKTIIIVPVAERKGWLFIVCMPDVSLGGLRMVIKKQIPLLFEML
jgi:DNA-binding response OmpR family regulator/predicted regulator of Ras-like GTPase activity (Roadblock/LC7/MglB family)